MTATITIGVAAAMVALCATRFQKSVALAAGVVAAFALMIGISAGVHNFVLGDVAADTSVGQNVASQHPFRLDIDRDGVEESGAGFYSGSATEVCVSVNSSAFPGWSLCLGENTRPWELSRIHETLGENPHAWDHNILVPEPIRAIGDHFDEGASQIAVFYFRDGKPALSVLSLKHNRILASAVAPAELGKAYGQWPEGPQGRFFPFLAPGYGDSTTDRGYSSGPWGYMCLFHPGATGAETCGDNFLKVDATLLGSGLGSFRSAGGYLMDADQDGYQDINLLYLGAVQLFSGRDGRLLNSIIFNVAEETAELPDSPWFHDGRLYGTHKVVESPESQRVLMVAGEPVGRFYRWCNVSRFVAVLENDKGDPDTRSLSWSEYYGFFTSIFRNPGETIDELEYIRPGDYLDGCIHRFSDSLVEIDGKQLAAFNVFEEFRRVDNCDLALYALTLPPPADPHDPDDPKANAWYDCGDAMVKNRGRWGQHLRELETGTLYTTGSNMYMWGYLHGFIPDNKPAFLMQLLPDETAFDLSDVEAVDLHVKGIEDGSWIELGPSPVQARPRLQRVYRERADRGFGYRSYFAELETGDVDGDGLIDVQLKDGSWIGWSRERERVERKMPEQ